MMSSLNFGIDYRSIFLNLIYTTYKPYAKKRDSVGKLPQSFPHFLKKFSFKAFYLH